MMTCAMSVARLGRFSRFGSRRRGPTLFVQRKNVRRPATSRRLETTVMAASNLNLLVVCGKDTPEVEVLNKLPETVKIFGPGKSVEDLEGLSDEDWGAIDVVLNCGVGENAAGKDLHQVLFPKMKNLKWFHSASAGVEHLMFPELVESSVQLTNAKGVYSHSLAEYVIAGCSWFAKDMARMLASQKQGKWDRFEVEELRGRTMGVIGLGDIGFASARLAKAYGMKIIGLRRNMELTQAEAEVVDKVYPPSEITSVMAESDYVVAALPYTPATEKFISKEALQAMKPNGVFVNVGRGKTVDEEALIEVLQNKKIKGAVLDVFFTEPLPSKSPLYQLDNVFMSAHCADLTKEFQFESLELFVDIVDMYQKTGELKNVVDKSSGY